MCEARKLIKGQIKELMIAFKERDLGLLDIESKLEEILEDYDERINNN